MMIGRTLLYLMCLVGPLVFVELALGGQHGQAAAKNTDEQLAVIRAATAKYHDVEKAKADGYQQASLMVPNMGYHFLNKDIKGTDPAKPHILLYVKTKDEAWQLVGVEYGFPAGKRPPDSQLPFKVKKEAWTVHKAACHFKDASEISEPNKDKCPAKNPQTGADFAFWHPDLETLHIWAWHPNPKGVFTPLNPLLAPYNPAPAKQAKK